ncbi:uncharacterized protein LOC102703286 [Oryza brachyantha]|uniref:Uncharacterized protein n=1 Tax=Oryza brachyantha TaxID=4533 RepID=J3LIM6_ORYBR|nr:uncharacterized protein LOC102703286 [Oryza brachyantha]XP_040377223.1 uncharacterized protein LOC102703286 [Oryza brachyantha]
MEKEKNDNLEVFLQAATPHLRWRSASIFMVDECFQAPSNVWQLDSKKDEVDYFTLQDLWEHYAESSVYGLAVPARLESGNTTITQHFVPYLSALQLYTTKPLLASSRGSMASETDSWSDGSTGDKLSRSWDAALSDDDYSSQHSSSSLSAKQDGRLNFQYIEWSSPYERVPLADKVAELAQRYPCLTSLNSAQLSPSSWMSVAWYPIYHIPANRNLKGSSACFLTYHSLSSVFQDNVSGSSSRSAGVSPFGLATYRAEGELWASARSSHLYWAASSWLKQLRAYHPDFIFFTSHRPSAFLPPRLL